MWLRMCTSQIYMTLILQIISKRLCDLTSKPSFMDAPPFLHSFYIKLHLYIIIIILPSYTTYINFLLLFLTLTQHIKNQITHSRRYCQQNLPSLPNLKAKFLNWYNFYEKFLKLYIF